MATNRIRDRMPRDFLSPKFHDNVQREIAFLADPYWKYWPANWGSDTTALLHACWASFSLPAALSA